eukprot:3457142-Alexandrium_andersonii.AAC.1
MACRQWKGRAMGATLGRVASEVEVHLLGWPADSARVAPLSWASAGHLRAGQVDLGGGPKRTHEGA